MRQRRIFRLGVASVIAVAIITAYAVYRQRTRAVPVDVVVIAKGDLTQTISATTASVQPNLDVVVGAERPGRVLELRVRRGQIIRRGDVVAVLADPVLEAELVQAGVDVERTWQELQRSRALSNQGMIPTAELESAGFAHRSASAKLAMLADEPTANLDSTRAREIMQLLLELNRRFRQTIVLVTHEHEYAAMAQRILTIKDGRVVGIAA